MMITSQLPAVRPPRLAGLSFLLALFFAAQSGLFAQRTDVFQHPLSAETIPRHAALCAAIAARPYVTGTFEQTKTAGRLNRSLTSTGNFIIAAGTGMVWNTVSPVPALMAMGRDFIVQSTPDGKRTKLDAAGSELFVSMAETMSAIFTGDAETLREQFEIFFIESAAAGETAWTTGLVPKDKAIRAVAERIVVSGAVTGAGALIRSITISGQNRNSVSYTLSGHRFPAGLSADEQALFSAN